MKLLVFGECEAKAGLVRQDILRELCKQTGQLFAVLSEAFAVFCLELGTCSHKVQVITFNQTNAFSIQLKLMFGLIQCINALKEGCIQVQRCTVRGQLGRKISFKALNVRRTVGGAEVEKNIGGLIQQVATGFKRNQCIFKRWGF